MSDIDLSHLNGEHIEKCQQYALSLNAIGIEPREVHRAYLYSLVFGLPGTGIEKISECVKFDIPTCGDRDCINPSHQVVIFA